MHPSLATADGTAGLIILNFDCHLGSFREESQTITYMTSCHTQGMSM